MSAYRIPVVNGTYDVSLLEAETYFTAAGKRVFSVTAEGRTVAKDVDVFARAGGKDKAFWIQFTTTVTDGWLDLGFTASVNHPKVNGISVLPAGSSLARTVADRGPARHRRRRRRRQEMDTLTHLTPIQQSDGARAGVVGNG